MARKSQSIFEDFVEIASKFPWWAGVGLATGSYLFLHWYAAREIPVAATMADANTVMIPARLHSFAYFGQFILPVAFLFGAIVSVIKRYKKKKIYDTTSRSESKESLHKMTWRDFEFLVGEYFRRRGFEVEETKNGADAGVDLIATKMRERYFVKCKKWKIKKVGVKVARELLGAMVDGGATGGIIVTSGTFTKDAATFAKANNILLLDGGQLHGNIKPQLSTERELSMISVKGKLAVAALLLTIVCSFVVFFFKKGLGPEEHSFTDNQIQQAMEEVLHEQKRRQQGNGNSDYGAEQARYLYEIELFNGNKFYIENAEVTDEVVFYTNDNGLVVSLGKDKIKTMKRINVDN